MRAFCRSDSVFKKFGKLLLADRKVMEFRDGRLILREFHTEDVEKLVDSFVLPDGFVLVPSLSERSRDRNRRGNGAEGSFDDGFVFRIHGSILGVSRKFSRAPNGPD